MTEVTVELLTPEARILAGKAEEARLSAARSEAAAGRSETAETNAETAEGLARRWASQDAGAVDPANYPGTRSSLSYARDARTSADASNSQANAASLARAGSEAALGLARTEATRAVTGAATADSAKAAVLAAIAGAPITGPLQIQAVSVDALRAITDRPEGRQAYLSQGNRAGNFVWSGADLSAKVAIDIGMGIYIPPAGQNGSQGAWVRVTNPGDIWMVSWFFDTLSDVRSGKIVQSIDLLAPAGVTIRFPATAPLAFKLSPWVTPGRGFTVGVICSKTRIWEGCGRGTIIEPVPTSDGQAHYKLFYTGASGIIFRDFMFRNYRNADSAGPPNPIQIRTPMETEIETGFVQAQDIYDTTVERVAWEDCDTGVREMYAFATVDGTVKWFQTYRTKIIDCTFVRQGYTAIVIDGNGAQVIRPDIDMIPGITRPYSFGIRVVGATDALIENPRIATGINDNAMGFMGAGVGSSATTGGFRYSRNVTVRNPKIVNGKFFYGDTGHRILIENMNCRRDPSLTDNTELVTSGSGVFPHDFGSFEIRGGFAVGYNIGITASPQNIHSITVKDFTLVGNARKGSPNESMFYKGLVQGNDHAGNPIKSPRFLTLERVNYIVDPSLVGFPITFTNDHTDMCITIRGCMFPEYVGTGPTYALMTGSNPWVNADGKGFVKLSTLTNIGNVLGDNARFPAGFYARYVQDINRAEFVDGAYPANWS